MSIRLGLTACLTVLLPAVAAAQSAASRYEPLGSWMTPYVDMLERAGVLRGLDPLTRPIPREVLRRALEAADTAGSPAAVRATVALLAGALADPEGPVRWSLEPSVGAAVANDASRWAWRPTADSAHVLPFGSLGAALEMPHLVLVTRPSLDNRLKYDPWYRGKQDRVVAGRNPDTYLMATARWADLFFGITDRNWGPPDLEGLLVSPSPYTTEHLFVRLGPARLRLEMLVDQLDTLTPWDSTPAQERWRVAHRLVIRPSDRLAISLSEATIVAGASPWRYLNPLTLGLLTQYDAGGEPNSLVAFDVSWRYGRAGRVFGQLMLDDFQVDDQNQGDQEPASYALSLGAGGALANGRATWTAAYTRVTNLAYRTPRREHQYTMDGVGMARNFSDYDEVTARGEALLGPGLLARVELLLRRQGQGDPRLRYPPVTAFADSLGFLTGVVEHTVGLGAGAAWTPHPRWSLGADLRYLSLDDAAHVSGAQEQRWVWRVQASWHGRLGGLFGTP